MFQDFRRRTTPETGAARLAALRTAMAEAGVDAFLVPRADAHQGENVAPRDERLAWLTGFTGSAGMALVTRDRAGDLRRRPLPAAGARPGRPRRASRSLRIPEDKPADWLVEAMPGGGRARLRPLAAHRRGDRGAARRSGPGRSASCRVANLVDAGLARPAAAAGRGRSSRTRTRSPGASSAEKRAEIARGLVARDLAAAVLTLPDSIAWLLNVRGVGHRPHAGAARLRHPPRRRPRRALHRSRARPTTRSAPTSARRSPIARPRRLRPGARRACRGRVARRRGERAGLGRRPARRRRAAEVVCGARPLHPAQGLQEPRPRSPAPAPRTCATAAAVAEFLAWLDATAPEGGLTEIDVVKQARGVPRRHRRAPRHLLRHHLAAPARTAPSCTTASPRPRTARSAPGELLLVDSGRAVPRRHHRHHPHRRRRHRAARRRSGRSRWSSRG